MKTYHVGKIGYTEAPIGEYTVKVTMRITHKASGAVTLKDFYLTDASDFGRMLDLLSNGPTGELWTWEAA